MATVILLPLINPPTGLTLQANGYFTIVPVPVPTLEPVPELFSIPEMTTIVNNADADDSSLDVIPSRGPDLNHSDKVRENYRQEYPEPGNSYRENPESGNTYPESLKQESLKQESLKQESLKQEGLKQESLNQESLKQENLNQESGNLDFQSYDSVLPHDESTYEEIFHQDRMRAASEKHFRFWMSMILTGVLLLLLFSVFWLRWFHYVGIYGDDGEGNRCFLGFSLIRKEKYFLLSIPGPVLDRAFTSRYCLRPGWLLYRLYGGRRLSVKVNERQIPLILDREIVFKY